jgi:ribonuclease D
LALDDLSPLGAVFSSTDLEKIYHASEYDIMTLKRDFGFEQTRLFDTYIAARTLGWAQSGLANLLERVFDVEVQKRFQRSNWAKRPLPEDMLNYARLDTHYLIPLRDHLADALRAAGRWEEAYESFQLQTLAPAHQNGFDPHGFWDIGDTRRLGGSGVAILRELYLWRESEAKRQDQPPFKILGNRTLLALARERPGARAELSTIKGLSENRIGRYGSQILDAIRRGMNAPAPQRPRSPQTSDNLRDRYEALHTWRKKTARQRNVDSDIILPRDYLWAIARANPKNRDQLEGIMQPLQWRYQTYADSIIKLLAR